MAESQFSEEEAQNWVDACLAQPDPPGFIPDTVPNEESTLQADNAQQASFLCCYVNIRSKTQEPRLLFTSWGKLE